MKRKSTEKISKIPAIADIKARCVNMFLSLNAWMDRVAAAKAADKLLSVDGVMASFAICKIENTVFISARSNGKINVQMIIEKLGGGGHFDAAATQLKDTTVNEALAQLKDAIDEYAESL